MKTFPFIWQAFRLVHGCFGILLAYILIACSGCGREDRKVSPRQLKLYRLVGVIKSLNAKEKEVRIRHEEIPGFMGAMTMPFTIKDGAVFDTLHPGDMVEGKLRVDEEAGMVKDYELTDLKLIKAASDSLSDPEKELTVSFAGGSPSLKAKPKTLEVGQEVPDFAMTDQNGKAFKLSDLKGDVVAITFIYTRCPLPDFCPLMDRKFSELASRIERSPKRRDNVRLISVSFDPEHDTPDVLKKHATIRGANPPLWTYAVASHEELAKIAPRLGLVYGPTPDEIIHNLCTAVIDRQRNLVRLEVGTSRNKWDSTDLLSTIDAVIGMSSK